MSPGRKPARFKPTGGERRADAALTSGRSPQAGPGPADRPSGKHKEPTAEPRVSPPSCPVTAAFTSGASEETRGRAGKRPAPGAGAPEEAGSLPAQARALRRRNAGLDAGFERRAAPRLLTRPLRRPPRPSGRQHRPASRPSRRRDPAETASRPLGTSPPVVPRPSTPESPPVPGLQRATWIRFLCRLRSAMLAAPPGSF